MFRENYIRESYISYIPLIGNFSNFGNFSNYSCFIGTHGIRYKV